MREEQIYQLGKVVSGGREYTAYKMPFQNVYDTLKVTAARVPDKTAVVDAQRKVTYAEFLKETDACAAYLVDRLNVKQGDKVGLMLINHIEFCVAFYALLKIGAVVVSINTKLSSEEIKYVVDDSEAKIIIVDDLWQNKIAGFIKSTKVEKIIVVGKDNKIDDLAFADVVREGYSLGDAQAVQDDSLAAVVMYTSGTTGKPKGACMTHFNLMQAFYAYAVNDDMDGHEVTVIAVTLFHITGLNCVMTLFVFLGGTMYLVPFFDAEKVLDIMTEVKCTYFHAVATVFILLEAALKDRHDLSPLTDALCGGGFITRETIQRFCRKAPNCAFHPVYGMTETAGAGTYCVGHCLDSDIIDSCGVISKNCELKVVDDNENTLGPGRDGEICFKGSYIINEYLHGVSQDSFVDGWLHSGDIGHLDEQGYLYIVDRKKDMINRGGEKVYSLSVETQIMKYGRIKQACVFATKDDIYGEVPAAVIIPEAGETIDLDDLRKFLRDKMAHYKVPVYMEIRESVPSTASGKPRKIELRKEFDEKYGGNKK